MARILDKLGNFLGTSNAPQINAATGTLDEVLSKATTTSAQNKQLLGDYLDAMKSTYGEGSQAYSDAVASLADAIEGYGKYDQDVNTFLDPAREMRTQQAMDAITNASAAGGNRFSSNYIDKVAAKQQALASDEWQKAYDRYVADRKQALDEQQQKIGNASTMANLYGSDRTALANALGDFYTNMASQNNADLQAYADIASGKANLQAQQNNGVFDTLGGISKIIGSFF